MRRIIKTFIPTIVGLSLNGATYIDVLHKYKNLHGRFLNIFRDEISNSEFLPKLFLPDTIQLTKTIPLVTVNIDNNEMKNNDIFDAKGARVGSQVAMQFYNDSNYSVYGEKPMTVDGSVTIQATSEGRVARIKNIDTNRVFLYPGTVIGRKNYDDSTKLFILPDETNNAYRAEGAEETTFDFKKLKNDTTKNKLNLVHFDTIVPTIDELREREPVYRNLPPELEKKFSRLTEWYEFGGSYGNLNELKIENVNNVIEKYKCEIDCGQFRPYNIFA